MSTRRRRAGEQALAVAEPYAASASSGRRHAMHRRYKRRASPQREPFGRAAQNPEWQWVLTSPGISTARPVIAGARHRAPAPQGLPESPIAAITESRTSTPRVRQHRVSRRHRHDGRGGQDRSRSSGPWVALWPTSSKPACQRRLRRGVVASRPAICTEFRRRMPKRPILWATPSDSGGGAAAAARTRSDAVMAGLDPGIHVSSCCRKAWMAGQARP